MNYPRAKDPWVSCITDSPNRDASSRFCLDSDLVPKPE